MSGLAADLLVLWVAATAAGSALLTLVVLAQSALARSRHRPAVRHRATGSSRDVPRRSGLTRGTPAGR